MDKKKKGGNRIIEPIRVPYEPLNASVTRGVVYQSTITAQCEYSRGQCEKYDCG
jgi:hypothetical protein